MQRVEGSGGLYILGRIAPQTEPDTNRVRSSLAALDLLVVQEIFPN